MLHAAVLSPDLARTCDFLSELALAKVAKCTALSLTATPTCAATCSVRKPGSPRGHGRR